MQLDSKITFAIHSKLVLGLRVNQDGYANCFLKNQHDQIYRIFPTSEQSNDYLHAGQVTFVPQGNKTQITLNSPSNGEEVGCIVSGKALVAGKKLPLMPLGATTVPNVTSLQEVFEQYQDAAGKTPLNLEMIRFDVE